MALQLEQIEEIKQQIISQIESTFPEDKKISAIKQIEAMDEQQLEEFLAQNNLIKNSETEEKQCIFCKIVSEQIPNYKISENELAIAVLEINPISRGHTLIIPKLHVQEISKETQEFVKQISLKLKEKLNAKNTQIEESEMFGHKIINIMPVYDDKTLKAKRQPAKKDILENLQKELYIEIKETKQEPIIEKEPEIISEKNTWLPKRIP